MILFSFHPRFSIWLLGIHLHLRSLAVTWPSKPAVHPERLHACLRAAPVPSQVSCGDQWIPTMLFNAPYIISLKMPHSPCHSIQEMLTEVQLISFRSSFCELFLFHEKSRFIIPVPQTITRPELAHLTYFFAPLKIQNPPPHPGKKRAHLVRSRFITIFLEERHGLGVCVFECLTSPKRLFRPPNIYWGTKEAFMGENYMPTRCSSACMNIPT